MPYYYRMSMKGLKIMNRIYYKLADIVIRMKSDFEYAADNGYMKEFILEDSDDFDYEFEFQQIQDINVYMNKAKKFVGQVAKFFYYQDDEGNDYCFHSHNEYLHAVTIIGDKKGVCYYISQSILAEEVNCGNHLENFFCLEKIFMKFHCMVLHSCHIHYDHQAILFTAPSGTGKSTQGDLWHQYLHAEIVNGDRTAIRKVNGVWYAFGVPFCGTSGINKNEKAPLKCIVVIRQYPRNIVERISMKQAFHYIYSELTINNWNQGFVNEAMDWTLSLIQDIPIYFFQCTKEYEAVDVLKKYIEGDIKND